MIGTDVHRVPFWQIFTGVGCNICDHPQGWFWRANIGAPAQIFLDDIVLYGALQGGGVCPLLLGCRDIQRQQPGRCGVDGHRGVHLIHWDISKQRAHVAQVANWNADLAHFTAS